MFLTLFKQIQRMLVNKNFYIKQILQTDQTNRSYLDVFIQINRMLVNHSFFSNRSKGCLLIREGSSLNRWGSWRRATPTTTNSSSRNESPIKADARTAQTGKRIPKFQTRLSKTELWDELSSISRIGNPDLNRIRSRKTRADFVRCARRCFRLRSVRRISSFMSWNISTWTIRKLWSTFHKICDISIFSKKHLSQNFCIGPVNYIKLNPINIPYTQQTIKRNDLILFRYLAL